MSDQPMMNGKAVTFAAGDILFREGDPGGDLYFLKSGQIQVYRRRDQIDVELALLEAGEVLGIMTCFTGDARLASARALTDVEAVVVKQEGFANLVSSTPSWVRTVVKDFILRICNMDDRYSQVVTRLGAFERRTSNEALSASAAVFLHDFMSLQSVATMSYEEVVTGLARVLSVESEHMGAILSILRDVKIIDMDGTSFRPQGTRYCSAYASFTRSYLSHSSQTQPTILSKGEAETLIAIAEIAKRADMELDQEVRLTVSKIKEDMESLHPGLFSKQALEAAGRHRLLSVSATGGSVHFVPIELEIKARSFLAWHKLRDLPFNVLQQDAEDQPAPHLFA